MLDPDLLDDFIRRFYGYGTWKARYWFIGMQEGGGDSLEEIERPLKAWNRRARHQLDRDVAAHAKIEMPLSQ